MNGRLRREEQDRIERLDVVLEPVHAAGHPPGANDLLRCRQLHAGLAEVAGVLEDAVDDVVAGIRVVDREDPQERIADVAVVDGGAARAPDP